METILNKITDIIQTYESGTWVSSDNLKIMQRELSCNMYYLTQHNIEAFNRWNAIVYNSNKSVSRAQCEAFHEVPELRMTRKILETAKGVSIAINSELKND